MSRRRYPIAVYGTLRPGGGLAHFWAGRASASPPVAVSGYQLFAADHEGFPYAVTGGWEDLVVANLLTPNPGCYDDLLADLDRVEGVPFHYERVPVATFAPTADAPPVIAWLYVAAAARAAEVRRGRPVAGNDWMLDTWVRRG